MPRVLVAGIGNVFCGDDGFGVEVARRLAGESLGEDVCVRDFGVAGVHLAYEMTSGEYDEVILVDAVPRGGAPGTLYAIEPDVTDVPAEAADAHGLTPVAVLAWVGRVGGPSPRVTVIGCEPGCLDESMELSAPVAGAVDAAITMVRERLAHRPRPEAQARGLN